ncbi:MAG: ABC transporter ATP-binding protein [Actinomycetota bacterium]
MNATDSWRGVAAEDTDALEGKTASLLQRRSRHLLGSLLRPYRSRIRLGTGLIVLNTAADLTVPFLVGAGIDAAIRPSDRHPSPTLLAVLAGLAAAVLVESITSWVFLRVMGRTTQDVLRDLRRRVFTHFQRLSLSFYERYTSGRVIARLTSDIDSITDLLSTGIADLVSNMLSIAGISVALVLLDRPLAAATLAVFPAVILLSRWFRDRSRVVYRTTRRTVALVIVHFVESLGGIRAVQAFRREARNEEIMADVNARYCDANVESIRLLSILAPGLHLFGRLATAVVLIYGGTRVLDGDLQIGVLVSFVLYVGRFFEPLQELSQVYNLLQASSAALQNLSGILEETPGIPEPSDPVVPLAVTGAVRLDNVTFAYRNDPVLHQVSLHVPAGQVVALVGRTGAGKTTVARLVSRFWDPTTGAVLLDDIDLRQIPDAVLRRHVAMVTQESFLFSGTVADNIALGRPEASRDEVVAAAEAIGARRFIESLPQGFDTDVRKRGGRLSSGQRQLVSFARAFLADPRVLILDEATSSLDIPSERLVQRALKTLLAGRTAIIIAHRLSTVDIADRVLVVDDGHIVEDGSPADLRASGGHYAALHAAWRDSLV